MSENRYSIIFDALDSADNLNRESLQREQAAIITIQKEMDEFAEIRQLVEQIAEPQPVYSVGT